jgi:hypothetical protein
VFLSVVWITVILFLSSFDEVFRAAFFVAVGVTPVALLWGIDWVVAGFRRQQ